MEAQLAEIISLINQLADLIIGLGVVGSFSLGFISGEGITS